MTRDEAAEELEFALDIAYKIAWDIEHKIFVRKIKRKEWRENHQNTIESLIMGINSLKTNPCDNCIGPVLAITHGYKNMKLRNPEVEGMIREEAERTLQEFYDFNKTLTPQGDSWLQADITINRETQRNLAEALPLAIEAMSRLLTDPETGLMPCGCGRAMRVECYPGNHGLADAYQVTCYDCNVGTIPMRSAGKAQVAWNRAMGYKEQ